MQKWSDQTDAGKILERGDNDRLRDARPALAVAQFASRLPTSSLDWTAAACALRLRGMPRLSKITRVASERLSV